MKSFNNGFNQARFLLSLAIFTKFNDRNINISLGMINTDNDKETFQTQCKFVIDSKSQIYYKNLYEEYKEIEFVYDYLYKIVDYKEYLVKTKKEIQNNRPNEKYNLNKDFYDGFCIDL